MTKITREYEATNRVEVPGFFKSIIDRFRAPKKYKLLKKFEIQLSKELDIEKIIHRLRFFVYTAMVRLTADQSVFVD